MRLEWDERKRAANRAKHGVDFADAEHVLTDARALTIPDDRKGEARSVTLGMGPLGRLLVVVHTRRADAVRVISIRKANARERAKYPDERHGGDRP